MVLNIVKNVNDDNKIYVVIVCFWKKKEFFFGNLLGFLGFFVFLSKIKNLFFN